MDGWHFGVVGGVVWRSMRNILITSAALAVVVVALMAFTLWMVG